jgi:hypothetical protein
MLHRFHRLEVHGIVLENCMRKSTERKLTMETDIRKFCTDAGYGKTIHHGLLNVRSGSVQNRILSSDGIHLKMIKGIS